MSAEREDLPWVVLHRYLAGEGTAADRDIVEAWARAHPAQGADLERLREVLGRGMPVADAPDLDDVWAAIQARRSERAAPVGATAASPPSARTVPGAWMRQRTLPFVTGAIAAAAAVLLIMIAHRSPSTAITARTYATGAGERETVTLADGSSLTLAPESRVRLAADYGRGQRDVYLDGEAYFAVVHDSRKPFTVHAANAVARDIGTRFVVRAYREEKAVQVVVAEGSVSLGDTVARGAAPVLTRGLAGRVDRRGLTTVAAGVDTTQFLSWMGGELAFDGAPLREVATELSRWYGVDVRVAPGPVGDKLFSGRFPQKSLDLLLSQIAPVVGVRVERRGATIVLSAADSQPSVNGSR